MDPRSGPGSPFGYNPFSLGSTTSPFSNHHLNEAMRSAYANNMWQQAAHMNNMASTGGSPLLNDLPFPRLNAEALSAARHAEAVASAAAAAATAAILQQQQQQPSAAYNRLSPFWEQMYRLHTANALRGLPTLPVDPRGPLSPDYMDLLHRHHHHQHHHSTTTPSSNQPTGNNADVFSMHAASVTPSMGLPFTAEGTASRLHTPRPESLSRIGNSKKRPLSLSPYGGHEDFNLNTVIRMSPNSLISGGNGSRCSSSASGTYGHLAAGALSPSAMIDPARYHQFQQYMQLQHAHAAGLFPSAFYPPKHRHDDTDHHHPPKHDTQQKSVPVVSSSVNPVEPSSRRKVSNSGGNDSSRKIKKECVTHSDEADDEESTQSPQPGGVDSDEAVETRCRWEDCQLEFQTNHALVQHVNQDHLPTNKKLFVCKWMDCCREEKPFKAHYMLVVHMRRHTGEKPHRCKFPGCNKAYSRLENLKTHERSHTGDRPYMCEFPGCTKAFTNASDRAKHQNRTHSNAKPYMCKVPGCSKRYTDPSSLRKHVKTVHGPEYFGNKKHRGNDVPRKHREHEGGDNNGNGGTSGHGPSGFHGVDEGHSNSSKSHGGHGGGQGGGSSGSEPSTPGGRIKQEVSELSPTYSHPSSVLTNCTLDSPLSIPPDFHNHPLSINNRSNEPIAEVENEMDIPDMADQFARDIRAAIYGGDVQMMPPIRAAVHPSGHLSVKPLPPPSLQHDGPINIQELNQRFTDMHTFPEPRSQYFRQTVNDTVCPSPQTTIRRDSNASIGTFYSSIPSDQVSRRVSEASIVSAIQHSPPYDPISVGSSRRSSEPSLFPNGTRSFYQQKIQMRQQRSWQQPPPPAAPPQPPVFSSCPPPGPPVYHGMRRASEPVVVASHQQRVQPLTRRNLQRHNSVSVPMETVYSPPPPPLPQLPHEDSQNLLIPDDMIRYLNQVADAAQRERTINGGVSNDDDDEDVDLPIIPQNYSNDYLPHQQPPNMPVFGNNDSNFATASFSQQQHRSASFSHTVHHPPSFNQRRQSQPDFYEQNNNFCMPQRQRRGAIIQPPPLEQIMEMTTNCTGNSGIRPLAEGSPDSYQVTSTTGGVHEQHILQNVNMFQQEQQRPSVSGQMDQFGYPAQQNDDMFNGNRNSNMVVGDMNTLISSFEHDSNQFNQNSGFYSKNGYVNG